MQIEKYKDACQQLSAINKNKSQYLIIHYSCESFFNVPNGVSPRITSIAIRSFLNGQTDSFSIHKTAERKGITLENINQHYDELELDMLNEYMDYLDHHQNFFFIHWNMRDINYGFKAIEHRYMVLQYKFTSNNNLKKIPDTNKIDLSILFVKKYGGTYIDDPKIIKLMEKNHLKPKDFLDGKKEAEAFDNQEYIKLHASTLSKTRVFDVFLSLAIDNKLKTNASCIQTHGYTPQAIWTLINEKWYAAAIFAIITFCVGKFGTQIIDFISHLLTP